MRKKQYKIKIENGKITPLEPIDLSQEKEGFIIFFEEEKLAQNKKEALSKMIGLVSEKTLYEELTPELIDKELYEEL